MSASEGGHTETLTTENPKASGQKVKTPPQIVELVDRLLDEHLYAEIAEHPQCAWPPPGRVCVAGQAGNTIHRAARTIPRAHVRTPLTLRPTARARAADQEGTRSAPANPRGDPD